MGNPTEKRPKMLDRISKATTSPGAVVFNPFRGCATIVVASSNRNIDRNWLGIDISPGAIDLVKYRRLKDKTVPVTGIHVEIRTTGMHLNKLA